MSDILPQLQETSFSSDFAEKTSETSPRKGTRLGRQAQLPVEQGFEEIDPVIAPLGKATASAAGSEPVILIDPRHDNEDSVAAFWAY